MTGENGGGRWKVERLKGRTQVRTQWNSDQGSKGWGGERVVGGAGRRGRGVGTARKAERIKMWGGRGERGAGGKENARWEGGGGWVGGGGRSEGGKRGG